MAHTLPEILYPYEQHEIELFRFGKFSGTSDITRFTVGHFHPLNTATTRSVIHVRNQF